MSRRRTPARTQLGGLTTRPAQRDTWPGFACHARPSLVSPPAQCAITEAPMRKRTATTSNPGTGAGPIIIGQACARLGCCAALLVLLGACAPAYSAGQAPACAYDSGPQSLNPRSGQSTGCARGPSLNALFSLFSAR